jgi:peptidoglycan/xylan/chitin deacetylase (PgdA/CDA1 family)
LSAAGVRRRRRIFMVFALVRAMCLTACPLQAASPAVSNRALWPLPLHSAAHFDVASRAEIAASALAFGEQTSTVAPPSGSVNRWRQRMREQLVARFRDACRTCAGTNDRLCPPSPLGRWESLLAFARAALASLPAEFAAWRDDALRFHRSYLEEQRRLAALFPTTTSEILPLEPTEMLGDDFPDRTFLLSFDDGPTPPGGTSDATIAVLRTHQVHGLFFVLGAAVAARRTATSDAAFRSFYAGMCVGSHGAEHRSHVRWPQAMTALAAARTELGALLPTEQPRLLFFRPPYGERTPEVLRSLARLGLTDVLWNIDSQDWQPTITAGQAADRVLTLMLQKRRGIVLFHDVHPKAVAALPVLWKALEGSTVRWMDCRELEAPGAQ